MTSDSSISNPLLTDCEYIPYDKVDAGHILPAVETVIKEAKSALESTLSLADKSVTNPNCLSFETTLFALIEIDQRVSRVWAPVNNLLRLNGTKEIREAADRARPMIVDFHNDLSLDPRVYQLVTRYAETSEGKNLTGERARYLSNTLRDLRLAGAGLDDAKKDELRTLNKKIADLAMRFTDNATDSKFEMILTNEEELRGLPADVVAAARRKADQYREKLGEAKIPAGAALFNLDFPSFVPFMRFADRGDLRKKIAFAYNTQGTDLATRGLLDSGAPDQPSLDNRPVIRELCALYERKAHLLGFKNHAEAGLTVKMARTPEKVKNFLESLASRVKPIAQKEYQALVEFQKSIAYTNTENDPTRIYPWDREYLTEKLRKARYDYDSSQTKPYFELEASISAIFDFARTLFGLKFTRDPSVPTWHPDVTVYQVTGEDGQRCGVLYLDLYPRDVKSQGAWVNPISNNCWDIEGERHVAQCVLVCNLTPPAPGAPSLLSFEEISTLFHEFGHAFHQICSTVELEPLGGLNVAYDFVELPSQLMENFCFEEISLKKFAKHYQTGADMPAELLEKILSARRFMAGIMFLRQLVFGLLDITVYTQPDSSNVDAREILREVIRKYDVFEFWEGTNFPCSFSHIFGGGYSAGYYSYKWSEVLEADAFSRFKEDGVLSAKVGREYRDKILSRGDSQEPMELFVDFMGREPKEDALLKKIEKTL